MQARLYFLVVDTGLGFFYVGDKRRNGSFTQISYMDTFGRLNYNHQVPELCRNTLQLQSTT